MPTVIDVIAEPSLREPVIRSLKQRANGSERGDEHSEDRLRFSGVSWEGYLALDDALGHDRSSPRLYWLDGMVEIMSTSSKHEELKKWIATLMEQFFIAKRIRAYPRGQATIKKLKEAGAEPDESWTFDEASRQLPELPLSRLAECAVITDWTDAILKFREAMP